MGNRAKKSKYGFICPVRGGKVRFLALPLNPTTMTNNNTAMQELRNKLLKVHQKQKEEAALNEFLKGYQSALINIVNDIDAQMLEIEKSQIIEAYEKGYDNGIINEQYVRGFSNNEPISSEEYFNKTYNK